MIKYDLICEHLKDHKKSAFYLFLVLFLLSCDCSFAQQELNDSVRHAQKDSLQGLLKTRHSPAALSVYKTNPFSIIWGPIPFTAEYKIIRETAVAPHHSFLVGISFLGKSPLLSAAEKANQNNSIPNNSGSNNKLKVRGMRVQLAWRYYFGKRNAPRGFYCGPQLSWSYATITTASQRPSYYIHGMHFNINALVGYQVIIRDKVSFDFFFGLGYKKNRWLEYYTPTRVYTIHDFDDITPLYNKPVKITLGVNLGWPFEVLTIILLCLRMQRILLLLCLMFSGMGIFAQPGSIDYSFLPGDPGISPRVIAYQQDGKVLTGGYGLNIIRFNDDGSTDTTFNTGNGFSASFVKISAISVQQDGKIVAGGNFNSYNAFACNMIVRLNHDGSIDTTFDMGAGFDNSVADIKIQPDGKILVAGYFTGYNGTSCNGIIRLNPDGSIDTDFNTGTGFNGFIVRILLYPDGKILAGGTFTAFNGSQRKNVACLTSTGANYPFFDPEDNVSNVQDIALQTGGKIIVVVGGIFNGGLIRLDHHGNKDASFNPDLAHGFDDIVYSMTTQPDGKIIAVGAFYHLFGVSQNCVARFDFNGYVDNTFDIGSGFAPQTQTVTVLPDGKIMIGGDMNNFDSLYIRRIARLNGDNATGISENEISQNISLYPNPATTDITIQSSGSGKQYTIKIFNALGEQVQSLFPRSSSSASFLTTIDISSLSNGLYYLTLESDEGVGVKKLEIIR